MNRQRFFMMMLVRSLLRRRSRMAAALLAITLGSAILSGLLALYYDIPRQMGREFRSYGANFLLLPAGGNSSAAMEDIGRALDYFPPESVVGAAPYRYATITINEQPFMAAGTDTAEARKTSPYWFVRGEWPEQGEVLVGEEAAALLGVVPGGMVAVRGASGPEENPLAGIGEGREFRVAGIVQSGGAEEAFVFMSMEDFDAMMGNGGRADMVECSISLDEAALEEAAAKIRSQVPGVEGRLVRRITRSEGAVLTKLSSLILLVTLIVLGLIMICVASTMMAVVAERRKEIGLRKALGAADKSLAAEFFGEGLFLGAAGGLLGSAAGFAFAQFIGIKVFGRTVDFAFFLPPLSVLASMFITAAACLVPVKSAVMVDPALVLRGE
jgi:putative ABC transport system permease protein